MIAQRVAEGTKTNLDKPKPLPTIGILAQAHSEPPAAMLRDSTVGRCAKGPIYDMVQAEIAKHLKQQNTGTPTPPPKSNDGSEGGHILEDEPPRQHRTDPLDAVAQA